MRVEPLAVEVGLGLVRVVEGGQDSPLLRRIGGIRRQLASELGFLLPPVRLTDNLGLKVGEYVLLLKGVELARYEIPAGCELAIFPGSGPPPPLEGIATREPAFGLPAWWIASSVAEAARAVGYTVVDAVSVLGTHLAELIRRNGHELFSRQDAKRLLDRVAEEHPKVVEDLVPKLLSLAMVQRVLQNLLRERVSIRDAVSILEALGEAAQATRNPVLLTEYVRQSIRRVVVQPYLDRSGHLTAYFLDPIWEHSIEAALEHGEHGSQMNLPPQRIRELTDSLGRALGAGTPGSRDISGLVVTSSPGRYFVKQILEPAFANVQILGHGEIPAGVRVTSLGVIR
jgi:flagellar biosynthesis protein FlhA